MALRVVGVELVLGARVKAIILKKGLWGHVQGLFAPYFRFYYGVYRWDKEELGNIYWIVKARTTFFWPLLRLYQTLAVGPPIGPLSVGPPET